MFINISQIVLRNILAHSIINKEQRQVQFTQNDFFILQDFIQKHTKEILEIELTKLLESIIQKKYKGDSDLFFYLQKEVPIFSLELVYMTSNNQLKRLFTMNEMDTQIRKIAAKYR